MSNTCAHCSRVNPPGAAYCYHDGRSLNQGGGPQDIGAQQFPAPFVFPGGRSCRSFDQLATGCQEEWASAVKMLREGYFERFLGGLGRGDLALAARTAAGFPDADRGLDQLLERLPGQALQPPRLQVEPTELNLGTLRADTDHTFQLHVANQGMRLLYGAVVSDSKWLTLGDGPGGGHKMFQCGSETVIPVTVHSRQLRAGNKPMEGKLVVESNGGNVTVRIKALVPAKAFTEGVLAGALTPRQLAEKARAKPRESAPLFQSGAVARWYEENGWTYPVQGAQATGLGAVQQFFEALGLAKAPKVEVSEAALNLRGRPGEAVRQALQVRTAEKRPVFASAASDQPWLTVGPVQLNGPVATIPLEVAHVPDQPGQVLQARISVVANGGQRFVVPVALAVNATAVGRAAAAAVVAPVAVAPPVVAIAAVEPRARPLPPPRTPVRKRVARPDANPDRNNTRLYLILGGSALLLLLLVGGLALLLSGGGDGSAGNVKVAVQDDPNDDKKPGKGAGSAVAKVDIQDEPEEITAPQGVPVKFKIDDEPEERLKGAPPQPVKVEIKDEPEEFQPGQGGKAVGGPVDPTPRLMYQYGQNQRFGITALKDSFGQILNKRITYSFDGGTSNTRLKVNGQDGEYGTPSGQWLARATPIPNDPIRQSRNGTVSVLAVGNLRISQFVEIVPSKQPIQVAPGVSRRLLDTVLCRYLIENKDARPHSVGLRVQVDTLIGNNDGVPFTVPGFAGLVNTMADFRTSKQVPEFIQALEFPNLQNPGTVALMTLKPGGGLEPPGRVSLTHWSGGAPWEVGVRHMGTDSAVIIYWNEKLLRPGQKRHFGYAYGLGRVDAGESGGRLGLVLGGDFDPGKSFTVTALVTNPVPGQTVTLEVPPGLRILGAPTVAVPRPQAGQQNGVVTWNTQVLQTGEFRIRVRSSTGVAQAKTISIARPDGGKLALEIQGQSFEPGQTFTVLARVTGAVPGQLLTITVPRGLDLVEGAMTQNVPAVGGADGASTVGWKVKIQQPGRYPVRVASSTGVAQTKTLTIEQPERGAGQFRVALDGDFAPGKVFTVSAHVADPLPGQALTLKLPPDLDHVGGQDRQAVPPADVKGGSSVLRWGVKVQKEGKYPLRIESTTGVTQRKTITIERGETGGRFVVELTGAIAPGKEFYVTARVTSPVKGQSLTLKLPEQLQRTEGEATQPVVEAGPGTGTARWTVRVAAAGRLPVRVESSTGVARTKTITITQGQGSGQIFGN